MSSFVATPLYRLVSSTTSVTLAAATTSANSLFNTNVPTGMYMNIRRLRWVIAHKTNLQTSISYTDQVLYELTEDTTKTVVAQKDPFALDDGGLEEQMSATTQAGINLWRENLMEQEHDFYSGHPGVPTVAQQLNVVVTGIRISGSSANQWDVFAQLYYELRDITEDVRGFLTNRIVLQRVT